MRCFLLAFRWLIVMPALLLIGSLLYLGFFFMILLVSWTTLVWCVGTVKHARPQSSIILLQRVYLTLS